MKVWSVILWSVILWSSKSYYGQLLYGHNGQSGELWSVILFIFTMLLYMSFQERLLLMNIVPAVYLKIAKQNAKKYKLNYKTLQFSNTKTKKLSIRDDDNKLINFGSSINNDFIIWRIFVWFVVI